MRAPKSSLFLSKPNVHHQRKKNLVDEAQERCAACPEPEKVNLTIGVYQDESGKPYLFPVVREVERQLAEAGDSKAYSEARGSDSFNESVLKLLFGSLSEDSGHGSGTLRVLQTLSATGALHLALKALQSLLGVDTVYISNHYYPCYTDILEESNFVCKRYPYFDKLENRLTFDALVEAIESSPERSVYLFNTCAHNPTGVDLSPEQWRILIPKLKARRIIPIMDTAYLGFVSCNPFDDAYPIRLLHQMSVEMLVTVSFSKCLSLYGERVGALVMYSLDPHAAGIMHARTEEIATGTYMCPPKHGADIVSRIMSSPSLSEEWALELGQVVARIKEMRVALFDGLAELKTPGDWSPILEQQGLFAFLNLSEKQVEYMVNQHLVFVVQNGRVNMSGINPDNVKRVCAAIHDAVAKFESL